MRYTLLTPLQLLSLSDECNELVNDLKLQVCTLSHSVHMPHTYFHLQSLNDTRKLKCMLANLEDHNSLVMTLSQADIPWLCQLLKTALHNGASICTIIRMIKDALERGYQPHTAEVNDLVLLVYCLSGSNLLYALSKRLALPSLHTLHTKMSFIKVTPTIGCISVETIKKNTQDVVIAPYLQAGPFIHQGVSFLINEMALEEAAVYLPRANGVSGLCWTHSHLINPTLYNYQSTINIATSLKSGKIHLAKEVTVVDVHIFGEDGLYPLLAAPTCKSENAADMEFVFDTVIDGWWMAGGEWDIGPLWSLATDGDTTRRKAGHRVFLKKWLPIMSPLYGVLSNLPGMNLYTGDEDVTLDFDYKHIIKCEHLHPVDIHCH